MSEIPDKAEQKCETCKHFAADFSRPDEGICKHPKRVGLDTFTLSSEGKKCTGYEEIIAMKKPGSATCVEKISDTYLSKPIDKTTTRCGTCEHHRAASDGLQRCDCLASTSYGFATAADHDWCKHWKSGAAKNPYERTLIKWAWVDEQRKLVSMQVDWYDIATAYGLSHPLAHAGKKLIDRGTGEKSRVQELREAIKSIERAIEMESE